MLDFDQKNGVWKVCFNIYPLWMPNVKVIQQNIILKKG